MNRPLLLLLTYLSLVFSLNAFQSEFKQTLPAPEKPRLAIDIPRTPSPQLTLEGKPRHFPG